MREPEFLPASARRDSNRRGLALLHGDRKQATAMGAMVLTLVIIWARMMAGSSAPRPADASLTSHRAINPPRVIAPKYDAGSAAEQLQTAEASKRLGAQLMELEKRSIPLLSCRFFSIDLDFSHQGANGPAGGQLNAAEGAFGNGLDPSGMQKSDGFRTDQQLQRPSSNEPRSASPDQNADEAKREQRRQEVFSQAQRLRLQGTMLGQVPKALINGQLVKVGDSVRLDLHDAGDGLDAAARTRTIDFKVIEISAMSVVVECDQIRLLISFRQ